MPVVTAHVTDRMSRPVDPFAGRVRRHWSVQPEGVIPDVPPPVPPKPAQVHIVQSLLESGPDVVYDVDLLDALNEEYRDKPLVARPRKLDPDSRAQQAGGRLDLLHQRLDFTGRRTLEIGCGDGYETWMLHHRCGALAHGVDIERRNTWADLTGDGVSFHLADIATDSPFPDDYFDRVISFSVWEHMARPIEALRDLYRILAPGGVANIMAALHAGTIGSHLHRHIYFPWPHLLFSDETIGAWAVSRGKGPMRCSWVNTLTWSHYRLAIAEIGFEVRALRMLQRPFDEEFYHRFSDRLGRYTREDLQNDGFVVVLAKPTSRGKPRYGTDDRKIVANLHPQYRCTRISVRY